MYFTFIASENLQLVTKWEVDTAWGEETTGGDSGADAIRLEMKNAYLDFNIPYTPVRAMVGTQWMGDDMGGYIINDDFSGIRLLTSFDPISVELGYIAVQNEQFNTFDENVDDLFLKLGYSYGPFSALLVGLYQIGNDTNASTAFETGSGNDFLDNSGTAFDEGMTDNNLFDLGVQLGYKMDWMKARVRFVKNFGSYEMVGADEDTDYEGWLVEGSLDFFVNAFTFTIGGLVASGDNDVFDGDDGNFRMPDGKDPSAEWSEILGGGTLDANVGGIRDTIGNHNLAGFRGYSDWTNGLSNVWSLKVGAAYQVLEGTKLTLNYWYHSTVEDVIGEVLNPVINSYDMDNFLGHEINFYLDQAVVDGLKLQFVAAYLFAGDALTMAADDDDIYEIGARLQWSF
jgi:hypothetical protein